MCAPRKFDWTILPFWLAGGIVFAAVGWMAINLALIARILS